MWMICEQMSNKYITMPKKIKLEKFDNFANKLTDYAQLKYCLYAGWEEHNYICNYKCK